MKKYATEIILGLLIIILTYFILLLYYKRQYTMTNTDKEIERIIQRHRQSNDDPSKNTDIQYIIKDIDKNHATVSIADKLINNKIDLSLTDIYINEGVVVDNNYLMSFNDLINRIQNVIHSCNSTKIVLRKEIQLFDVKNPSDEKRGIAIPLENGKATSFAISTKCKNQALFIYSLRNTAEESFTLEIVFWNVNNKWIIYFLNINKVGQ